MLLLLLHSLPSGGRKTQSDAKNTIALRSFAHFCDAMRKLQKKQHEKGSHTEKNAP
jgi:hypothetical protein